MRAVNLIPVGIDNRAEQRAMCSFPFPEAIVNATSNPEIFGFSFSRISFFRSTSLLFKSILINSNSFPLTSKILASSFPRTNTLSHSPLFINPETCVQVSSFELRRAINSIAYFV